jgi:RNA polymerase sigma-70 factor (ECF subfamily)
VALHEIRPQISRVSDRPESPDRIEAIRRGDPAVLDEIARRHLAPLRRASLAAGLAVDDAWDVVQETLVVFVRRAHEYDGRAGVKAWLFGILYRKIMELRRAKVREEPVDDVDAVFEARFGTNGRWSRPPRSPEEYTMGNQAMSWLEECLQGLSERRRLAFVLREVEQLPTEEVCKILEVSGNNLGVLLFRARNGLRECLESKGIHGSVDVTV